MLKKREETEKMELKRVRENKEMVKESQDNQKKDNNNKMVKRKLDNQEKVNKRDKKELQEPQKQIRLQLNDSYLKYNL
jgi:hypothetical protein